MTNAEKLNCLTDRPCTVCKYHKENGCSKWSCVFEQEPTTKNDLSSELDKNSKKLEKDFGELDCISRADAIGCLAGQIELSPSNVASVHEYLKCVNKRLHDLPSVTPQEPTDKSFTKADIDAIVKAINAHWELIIDEIKSEIENYKLSEDELTEMDEDSIKWGMKIAYDIIEKQRGEQCWSQQDI